MKPQVKLAIIGSRVFRERELLVKTIDKFREDYDVIEIISGGAQGADKLGEEYGISHNIKTTIFPANWGKYGRGAGFRRNYDIIKACDIVIAFWDGKSAGTQHSIKIAREQGKTVIIVHCTKC